MEIRLSDIESWEEIQLDYVYDIEVEDNHNFILDIGEGIVVHNSSKTVSILQLLYLIAKHKKKHITFASYALPHLKGGVIMDFDKILMGEGIYPDSVCNRSEHVYYIGDSTIEYLGIEGNEARATGPRRDILYINEANKRIAYNVFDLMNSRTADATFIDFNPSAEFWFHEKVMPNFKYELIKSTFLDNPYLPERERENILAKKNRPGFENWWRVYGEGELGKLDDAILPNWEYGEFDGSLPFGFGLDFGFNDPDAMTKVAVDHKRMLIYVDEMVYQSGNSFEQLRQILETKCTRNDQIIADAADARMIAQLKRFFNIRPVNKAKWTVAEALKMMQGYKIIVTENSYNLAKELNNYVWNDKKAGVPIGDFNHLIDSMRYYFQESVKPKATQRWTA